MAVGEIFWPHMHPVKGVTLGTANARIKDNERDDVLILSIDEGSHVCGVFTQNAFCAEPVKIAKQHLLNLRARFLLINSGNANACTGSAGYEAAIATCKKVASVAGVNVDEVLPFSTGVIGELLPHEKIAGVVEKALMNTSANSWDKAAKAIMTTDTRPKGASEVIDLDGGSVTITGISKGAGMINPNMATMLAFVATDVSISSELVDEISKVSAIKSFNRITIDGDTSTNDACVLIATGKAKNTHISSKSDKNYSLFVHALERVYKSLAQAIVRDGEGATKFITVKVSGGATVDECEEVAYSIAHSPLVKTAMFASDPNWGRIICAIGNAGVKNLDVKNITVYLDDVLIVEHGGRAHSYREEHGQSVVDNEEFTIAVNLGRGQHSAEIWTSDLSHEYIRINAEYRS